MRKFTIVVLNKFGERITSLFMSTAALAVEKARNTLKDQSYPNAWQCRVIERSSGLSIHLFTIEDGEVTDILLRPILNSSKVVPGVPNAVPPGALCIRRNIKDIKQTWCGARLYDNVWTFQDIDHAAEVNLSQTSPRPVCSQCREKIFAALYIA